MLAQAIRLDPMSMEALRGLEQIARASEDSRRAEEIAGRAKRIGAVKDRLLRLRSSPDLFEARAPAYLEIGELCREGGLAREALKYFQLAREARPEMAEAHRAFSELVEAPEQCFIKARALADILRILPGDAAASRELALILARLGVRLDRAEELARAALRAGESADGHHALGLVLVEKGDLAGAGREAEMALRSGPQDPRFQELSRRARGEGESSAGAPPGPPAGSAVRKEEK